MNTLSLLLGLLVTLSIDCTRHHKEATKASPTEEATIVTSVVLFSNKPDIDNNYHHTDKMWLRNNRLVSLYPGTEQEQILVTDTLFNEEIDLRSLYLVIQYEYDKESIERSDSLRHEQTTFLKSVGLPTSGIEDIQGKYDQNLTTLDKEYVANLKKIKDESYRKIYRQVASQVLIKHICLSPALYSSNQERDRKLVYYLREMKEAGGLNIELICASFTLLQESKEKGKVCESLQSFIPYCQWIVSDQEGDIKHLQQNLEKDPNPVEQFIFDDISKRISKNKKYIHYLTNLQNNTCK